MRPAVPMRVTCTFVKAVNGNAGQQVTDVVEVTGTDDDGETVKDDDDATVLITGTPSSINVIKDATPASKPEPGGDFTFDVTSRTRRWWDSVTITSLVDRQVRQPEREGHVLRAADHCGRRSVQVHLHRERDRRRRARPHAAYRVRHRRRPEPGQ